MAHCCKDCERLNPNNSGSAPIRAAYQQPTMYDHFSNFQKFKQCKEDEKFIKKRQEELLKFNESFTDWQVDPKMIGLVDDGMITTQELVRFRQQIRMHNGDHSLAESMGGAVPDPQTGHTLTKKTSLLTLSRTPVQCPIAMCERTIGVTSVLSHYLRDHSEDFGVECQEVTGEKCSLLVFDSTTLNFQDNVCLGVLAYGGATKNRQDRPAERGICMHNAFLPKPHEQLDAHLPILIMACLTTCSAISDDKDTDFSDPNDETQHLLVLWLVSVQTTKPIYVTLSAYDKAMSASRSTIIQVRRLNDSQNPMDFLPNDANNLRLNCGEIDLLTQGKTECIHLEVLIKEYD